MPVYVSLLRGINVGGHKIIKMDQLRASLETLGLKKVKTYIQSGNIVFETKQTPPHALSKKIEAKILADFGHAVPVLTRTAEELAKAISGNPLVDLPGVSVDKLHIMFLSEAPSPSAVEKLQELITSPEQAHCLGWNLYFHLPNGVADSIIMKKPMDRILGVTATTRNWRTVKTLHQMCRDCG